MNECDLDQTVVEHVDGFTMVDIRNIEIPRDFGSSCGGFTCPPITLNSQKPNLSIINHGFTMVDTRNIEIPCDFGSSYGGFNRPPHHSQFPNTQFVYYKSKCT